VIRTALLWLALLFAVPAAADEFKPAYLQLTERGDGQYDVLWKVPALDEQTVLRLKPVFPPGARDLTPHRATYADGATVQRWRIAVSGGLAGKQTQFAGLALVPVDVLVRLVRADGTEQIERLNPANPAFLATASPGPWEVVQSYTLLGIEHIWRGVDHLLFVLSLIMLVDSLRKLLLTITAFTVAHSITLALATLGVIHVPGPPVEAAIALSIVFVAAEILHRQQGRSGLAVSKPWLVAFSFGLLHGLGFAGALAEVGLPQNSIPLALLFFNVGAEIGQMLFVAAVLAAAALVQRLTGPLDPRWSRVLPSYAIGGIASYWVFERIAAF